MRASGGRALIWVVCTGVGVVLAVQLLSIRSQDEDLRRTGITASALVVDVDLGGRFRPESATVEFVDAAGRTVRARLEFGADSRLGSGQTTAVVYDPVDPKRVSLVAPQRLAYRAIWCATALGFGSVFLLNEVLFFLSVRRAASASSGRLVRTSLIARRNGLGADRWIEVFDDTRIERFYVRAQRGQDLEAIPDRVEALGPFRVWRAVVLRDGDRYWWPRGRAHRGYPGGAR